MPTTAAAPLPPPGTSQPADSSAGFPVKERNIYMVGIGGCGMAGMARMLKARGAVVSGSDLQPGDATSALAAEGIAVGFDQSKPWLPESCDLVIASAAIRPDHPQMLECGRRGIPWLSYAEALGKCMLGRTAVAVAGTHGKSTTTAMLGAALTDAGLDPTVVVGATCPQLVNGALKPPGSGAGFRLGADRVPLGPLAGRPGILVAEACEFNRSFHNYRPRFASISSIEADHLDIYGSLDEVVNAFHQFAQLIAPASEGGCLLIADKDAHRRVVASGLSCRVETIGYSPDADWGVQIDPATRRIHLFHDKTEVADWGMMVPGAHNAMNAATACALAGMMGADLGRVVRSLAAFRGVDRRMHFLGERPLHSGPVRVYDDYGHHPTEVDTTLRALRDHEKPHDRGGRLICIFQPHQHSRTRHLLDEFASAFQAADTVIVPEIYFVRDSIEERQKVTAKDLVLRLREKGVKAMHLDPFEAIIEQLENICRGGDVLVVMGAGPVYRIAHGFLGVSQPGHGSQP